jgi:Tc toxin complex TcA C-terminal TcB-binding domain
MNIKKEQENGNVASHSSTKCPSLKSATVKPDLAKTDEKITVTVVAEPGGRVRFSIAQIYGATDVSMPEDPDVPGSYSGSYTVQWGDNVQDAAITVVFTTKNGETFCHEAWAKVTIDTIPPRILEAKLSREVVSNGQMLGIEVISEKNCCLSADVSDLDTTEASISLNKKRGKPGHYQKRIKISKENQADNGIKNIKITAIDAAGNESEPEIIQIELRNSELKTIEGLNDNDGDRLNKAGVVTLSDLRRIEIKELAHRTEIPQEKLEHYRAAAKLHAIGLDADVVHGMIEIGDILSPAELSLTSPEKLGEIVAAGVDAGLIPAEKAADDTLVNQLIAAGMGAMSLFTNIYWTEHKRLESTCQTECTDEFSAFGCHAYLLELKRISELSWNELEQKFKQDFLAVTTAPARRIDISIKVLQKALSEDLNNPLRLPVHWTDYDQALNTSLIRLLVESTGKSEAALAVEHAKAFNDLRALVDRNQDVEQILAKLPSTKSYYQFLIGLLKKRTGKSDAELKKKYPNIFPPATFKVRNQALETILEFNPPSVKVEEIKTDLAGLELEALVKQSRRPYAQLRKKYYISFEPVHCAETTTCRQAVLTLQEYLALRAYTEPKYEFPTYDEWRVEQVRKFYPENIYTHEFKIPLITGNRQLLRQHLEQARTILDSVRVSVGGNRPQKDDLLNSFRWRNPYYTNLKAGLDLIQKCYDVDDLMVKGHQAFFNEEQQQARHYYLEAAEKIRLTSKQLSKSMGESLLPLWAPEDKDSHFKRGPEEFAKDAKVFFEDLLLSYVPKNVPGIELARGQVKLTGIDANGTFEKLYKSGQTSVQWKNHLDTNGWEIEDGQWVVTSDGGVWLQGSNALGMKLKYKHGNWTDLKIQVDINTQNYKFGGVLFRYPPLSGNKQSGYVEIYDWNSTDSQSLGTLKYGSKGKFVDDSWQDLLPRRPFVGTPGHYRILVEIRGSKVEARFWNVKNGVADPDGLLIRQIPALRERGTIALWADRRNETSHIFTNIAVWDLSPATGTVSDIAFFLESYTRFPLSVAYLYRTLPQESIQSNISLGYEEWDWIIEPHDVDSDSFDPFYQEAGEAINGLWYGQGDDRLNRESLRRLLDGLPRLFCHQYFFLLPVCLGDVANALGQFEEALQWYRLIYDERRSSKQRPVYPYLNKEIEGEMMRIRIAQNYVEWAEFLFDQNTEESLGEARFRYRQALHTLESERCCEQNRKLNVILEDLIRILSNSVLPAGAANAIYHTTLELADKPGKSREVHGLIDGIQKIITDGENVEIKTKRIDKLLAKEIPAINPQPPLSNFEKQVKTLPTRLAEMEKRNPEVLDDIEANIRINKSLTLKMINSSKMELQPAATALLPPPLEGQPSEGSMSEATPALAASLDTFGSFAVPFEIYKDPAVVEMYHSIGPLLGLPDNIIPELPEWLSAPESAFAGTIIKMLPPWVWLGQCVPKNTVMKALTQRACLGIDHIDYCYNALGFPQGDLSIYRFEYLISLARNFAQMALAAEKDFIQFKEQFEQETVELMNASQGVAIAEAGTRLAQLKVQEALDQIATANLGIVKVNAQITLTQNRINALGSDWSIFGIVLGGIAVALGSALSAGLVGGAAAAIGAGIAAGAGAGFSGTGNYMAGMEENEENLRMQLQLLRTVEYNAAQQNRTNAFHTERTARQQARIAELEAKFMAEKVKLLASDFFNPQLWSFLAREIKKNYRVYLSYGSIAAWLAQRALEFERGVEPQRRFAASGPDASGSGINIIRFDYFQPALQGLLGADNLLRDIAILENEKFLNEQRKLQITKVISLANRHPLAFAQFLETGVLPFTTPLEDFDQDYPGHYQRRIRRVRVNLFGLIGPEGIKATLTCLGSSQVVVRGFVENDNKIIIPKFIKKTLRRPLESVALTNPQGGGIGQIPLAPKEQMLKPFEGQGVAVQWIFELPNYANAIDYNTITDVQIVIDYSALDDLDYRKEVIKRLPVTRNGIRPYSFCAAFPDTCFNLKDGSRPIGMIETKDGATGAYTLVLETREADFPPNQKNRRLKEVIIYFRSKDETDYSGLKLYLTNKQRLDDQPNPLNASDLTFQPNPPGEFVKAETPGQGDYDPKPHYLGKWTQKRLAGTNVLSVANTWYLHIPPSENNKFLKKKNYQEVVVNGRKVYDFSGVQDVILALHYDFDLEKPLIT